MRTGTRQKAIGKSKTKIFGFALCTLLLPLCVRAEAQQPKNVPRVGFVLGSGNPNTPGPQVEALQQGLRDLGYVEGKNILIEYRYVEGKVAQPDLVTESEDQRTQKRLSPYSRLGCAERHGGYDR